MTISPKALLKKSSFIYSIVIFFKDKEFRKSYLRYLNKNPKKKSRTEVKKDLKLLIKYWNCPSQYYYLYDLYIKKLPEDQLLDYIPPYYYYNIYWEKRNKHVNKKLFESKIFQDSLFKVHKIPSIKILAIIKSRVVHNCENLPMTIYDLLKNYLKYDNSVLVCKPEFGAGGKGIILVSRNKGVYLVNNKPAAEEKILSYFGRNENYIVQEQFVQSKEMARINNSSVNTLRIFTQIKDNKVVLPACILRMGLNNSFVDNLSQGGLMNIVNVDNGFLSDYALKGLGDKRYNEHPDSKYVFKNNKINNWEEIKSEIIKYAHLLKECKDIGWDIAVGEKGFKVLEINISHGMYYSQILYGGMRKILGIYPELYNGNNDV